MTPRPAPAATRLLACLALSLTGCTIYTGRVTHYFPDPAVVQSEVDCTVSLDGLPEFAPSATPSPLSGSVPEGFVPEKVFICRPGPESGSGAQTISREELRGDFTTLLAALAEPSDRGEANVACPAIMDFRPGLWLVDAAGGAVHIAWPTGTCGTTLTKPDTEKAIDALKVMDSKVRTVPGEGK